MPKETGRRSPLTPWWIGLAINLAVIAYVAYRFSCPDCAQIGLLPELLVLLVIPGVYLTLMYLTLNSQSESERE